MAKVEEILTQMRLNPKGNHYSEGMAKAYQVRQVLKAIERLEAQNDVKG